MHKFGQYCMQQSQPVQSNFDAGPLMGAEDSVDNALKQEHGQHRLC